MTAVPGTPALERALDDVEARFRQANPGSRRHLRSAARFLPGGNTRVALHYDPFPLVIRSAHGARVRDVDGHDYVDFMNDLTAGLYGHSDPTILAAVRAALDRGVGFGGPNEHEARLAEAICGRFPSIERVRFCNSGTEASLVAMSLARAFTERRTVLAFRGGYHGSMASYLAGHSPLNVDRDRIAFAAFNDVVGAQEEAGRVGGDLAAIIVEPMMGSGGGILADRAFLAALRHLADESGALLIFDEVQTARFAAGGLQEITGVRPDLTTLGKFVGGGFAFGAFGGRADVVDRLDPTRPGAIGHGGTFNNNVLTMVAGHAGLSEVATPAALAALNRRGDALRETLRSVARQAGVPLSVGAYGSILSLHFQPEAPRNPGEIRTPPGLRKLVHLELLLRGVYVARRGTINLSLAAGNADDERFVEAFAAVLGRHRGLFEAAR